MEREPQSPLICISLRAGHGARPVWLRGPGLGAGRGHFGQSCTLAKDKGGSDLSTQQYLLPPQEAWEGTQDTESVRHGSTQLLCSLNEWLSLSVPVLPS